MPLTETPEVGGGGGGGRTPACLGSCQNDYWDSPGPGLTLCSWAWPSGTQLPGSQVVSTTQLAEHLPLAKADSILELTTDSSHLHSSCPLATAPRGTRQGRSHLPSMGQRSAEAPYLGFGLLDLVLRFHQLVVKLLQTRRSNLQG